MEHMHRMDPSLLLGSLVAAQDKDRVPRLSSATAVADEHHHAVAVLRRPDTPPRERHMELVPTASARGPLVAVVEPLAPLRHGLVAVLEDSGYEVVAVDALADLAALDPPFLITTVRPGELDALAEFVEAHPGTVVVGLPEPGSGITPAALRAAGASGVIPRGSAPETVLLALCASSFGLRVVPDDDVAAPARPERRVVTDMSDEERGWLRGLASGQTVAALAHRSAYSERELYRRLGRLYRKLGATGRVEAMLKASSWGLL